MKITTQLPSTHSALANSAMEMSSGDFIGGDGVPGATGSDGFKTAARPTDFAGDIVSVVDTTTGAKRSA